MPRNSKISLFFFSGAVLEPLYACKLKPQIRNRKKDVKEQLREKILLPVGRVFVDHAAGRELTE